MSSKPVFKRNPQRPLSTRPLLHPNPFILPFSFPAKEKMSAVSHLLRNAYDPLTLSRFPMTHRARVRFSGLGRVHPK